MKTLVVFDSFFGNTEKIAQAIAAALGGAKIARSQDVRPNDLSGLDLLVVGSPTRAFRPSPSITNLLNKLPDNSLKSTKVAAFDTRIDPADVKPRILGFLVNFFGYAAKPIANKLQKKGGTLVAQPEGFCVKDTKGPLKDNEIERAKSWARSLIK